MMSIYHYGMLIEGIDQSLSQAPSFMALVVTGKKRAARKQFDKIFPDFQYLRHAIAHSAERYNTVAASRKHGAVKGRTVKIDEDVEIRLSDEKSFLVLNDLVKDGKFISMWKGRVVKCEITENMGKRLDEITDKVWDAFADGLSDMPEPPPTITFGSEKN